MDTLAEEIVNSEAAFPKLAKNEFYEWMLERLIPVSFRLSFAR